MLLSRRSGRDLTRGFLRAAQALSGFSSGTVIDGELVVLDAEGRPDFGVEGGRRRFQRIFKHLSDAPHNSR